MQANCEFVITSIGDTFIEPWCVTAAPFSSVTVTIYITIHSDFNITQAIHASILWKKTRGRYAMETLSALLALCEGNPPVPGGFPSQRPVIQSFDFPLRETDLAV